MTDKRGLALFFTQGVSLKDWQEAGYLEREAAYYQRLSEFVGPVSFVTYGWDEDAEIAQSLDGIRVLNNWSNMSVDAFARQVPKLFAQELSDIAIMKSNQIKGAMVAVEAADLYDAKSVVRGGYLLSRFRANRGLSLRMRLGLWRREWKLFHKADSILMPTDEDAAYVRQWYALPDRIVSVVPNFIDTDLFKPMSEITKKSGLIGFVGRLSEQKNLINLLDAVSRIEGVSLRLIGDGDQRGLLEKLAAEKKVSVEFRGRVTHEEIPALLAECEIFALPSLYEGLPKALLEAMAIELPILVTPVEGSREIVEHNESGWVCDDTSAEAIFEGLTHLFGMRTSWERLGTEARIYATEHYSIDSVMAKEVDAYRRLGLV